MVVVRQADTRNASRGKHPDGSDIPRIDFVETQV
jgi:hypothetical protein